MSVFHGLDVQQCLEVLDHLDSTTSKFNSKESTDLILKFWNVLSMEIQKINKGYVEREKVCLQRFQIFEFRTFVASSGDVSLCNLFQDVIREVYPSFESAQMSSEVLTRSDVSIKKERSFDFYYTMYRSFCELLRDVHLLRDFVLRTFNVLYSIIEELKKIIVKHTNAETIKKLKIDSKFRDLCDKPLYNSSTLSKLCTRAETIATSILCAQNSCAPQHTAFVCFSCFNLSQDMYVLSCFHRFCGVCIYHLKSKNYQDCPTCKRHNVLLQKLERDEPLRSFIATHFKSHIFRVGSDSNIVKAGKSNCSDKYGVGTKHNIQLAFIPRNAIKYHEIGKPAYLIPKLKNGVAKRILIKNSQRRRIHGRRRDVNLSINTKDSHKSNRTRIKPLLNRKTSCHQCKNSKVASKLLFCRNIRWGPGKKKGNMLLKHCRKKFCGPCMSKYESSEMVDKLFTLQAQGKLIELGWQCPGCSDNCKCAKCWRLRGKQKSFVN